MKVLMSASANEAKVDIKFNPIPANASILIDAKLIEQVFINLINNSLHALEGIKNPAITM